MQYSLPKEVPSEEQERKFMGRLLQAPPACLWIDECTRQGSGNFEQRFPKPYIEVCQSTFRNALIRKNRETGGNAKTYQDYIHRFVKGLPKMLVTSTCINFAEQPEAKLENSMSFVSSPPRVTPNWDMKMTQASGSVIGHGMATNGRRPSCSIH